MRAARFSAILLASMSLALMGLWIVLSPEGFAAIGPMQAASGGLMLLAVLALIVQAPPSGTGRLAVAVLSVVPTVLLLVQLLDTTDPLAHWPLAVSALAAALAILTLAEIDPRDPMPTAALPLGAALLGMALIALATPVSPLAAPEIIAFVTRTPVHLALVAVSSLVLAGLIIAVLRRDLGARGAGFLRAMIGLLPLMGFTGTILGIIATLRALPAVFGPDGNTPEALAPVLAGLATAFETTLIGLVASVVAGFLLALLVSALTSER